MKIALAQINPTLGAIDSNQDLIIEFIKKARCQKADIIIFPEFSICGYPPQDLLFSQKFIQQSGESVKEIISKYSQDVLIILGCPTFKQSKTKQKNKIYNSALVGLNGDLIASYRKMRLPNYGVFDEKRYFKKGEEYLVVSYKNQKILISICEDIWQEDWLKNSPLPKTDFLINISASPYTQNKIKIREKLIQNIAQKYQKPIYLCNLVGGQDELVFDGNSLVVNKYGEVCQKALHSKQDLLLIEHNQINQNYHSSHKPKHLETKKAVQKGDQLSEIYQVLKLGVFDYIHKNNFTQVILGLSGGIDSALNLALLVDVLGKNQVLALMLPSRFNQSASLTDAIEQCQLLGNDYQVFSIDSLFQNYLDEFDKNNQTLTGLSLQNIQARIRANILMAIANQQNRLLIATSNKSEIAVGYSTIYGDMAGAFCPLKDVQKTLVYELASWLNQNLDSIKIPNSIIAKTPSAELAPNQKDQDNLPDYAVLDAIMNDFLVDKLSKKELCGKYNSKDVNQIVDLIIKNEYKRFQGSPGIKLTEMSFTKDWRLPLSNQFKF